MLKTSLATFLCFLFLVMSVLAEETITNGTALFVTPSGHAITSANLVRNASKIQATLAGEMVTFHVTKKDALNGLVILEPDVPVTVKPASLFMGDPPSGAQMTCFTHQEDKNNKQVTVRIDGTVLAAKGIAGDIRHLTVQLPEGMSVVNGPVFNASGLCVGYLLRYITDLYQLVQSDSEARNVFLAVKSDSLFPLIKTLPDVSWYNDTTPEPGKETELEPGSSVLSLAVTHPSVIAERVTDLSFEKLRRKIPTSVPFLYVKVASGYDDVGFGQELLSLLDKYKIGNKVSSEIKQAYYRAILEKYGHVGISAYSLVKMAADLSDGYFLEASLKIAAGDIEDSVTLKMYKSKSITLLGDVVVSAIVSKDPDQVVRELTDKAVKELSKQMKKKT